MDILSLALKNWKMVAVALAVAALAGSFLYVHARGVARGEANIRAEWTAANLEASEAARAREKTWSLKLAVAQRALEQERQEHAKREADLRRDVELGTRKLLILAQRPGGGNTDGTGGSDAEPVELSRSSRQAYFDLRAGIVLDTDTLKACQAYVRAIGGWPPPD